MRLTKRKALEICRDLWGWLAETGWNMKTAWPGWEKHPCSNDCPCCEYVLQRKHRTCDHCPLRQHWPSGIFVGDPCCQESAWYRKWSEEKTKTPRRRYAAKIRDAAIAELEKL